MQASGFLDQRTHRHPVGMGVIVAAHAAAIGALMLAKAPIVERAREAIELINITPDRPPPQPVEPPPAPRDTPKARDTLTNPTQIVRTDTSESDFIRVPINDSKPLGSIGTGPVIEITPPPIPMPVLTDAALDRRFADQFQPPYPPGKQRLGEEGKAVLRVLIGTDGRVKKVERVSGDESFLEVSERQALRRWRFKPATRDGVPVETWKTMTVRFEMT